MSERTDPSQAVFGDFVRERRKAAGLTQQELAEAIGISRPYLSQIERGQNTANEQPPIPRMGVLRAMVEILNRQGVPVTLPELARAAGKQLVDREDEAPFRAGALQVYRMDETVPLKEQVPIQLPDLYVLEVRGGWAEPEARDGEILILRRPEGLPDREMLGQKVVLYVNGRRSLATFEGLLHREGALRSRFLLNEGSRDYPIGEVHIEGIVVRNLPMVVDNRPTDGR